MTQTGREGFAMSSNVLDQTGRTGDFHHFIRWKATINDMGLDNIEMLLDMQTLYPLREKVS